VVSGLASASSFGLRRRMTRSRIHLRMFGLYITKVVASNATYQRRQL